MSDLFEQIAKASNPNPIDGLEIALKKSLDNFDTIHAELMEAIGILHMSRKYVNDQLTIDIINAFLKKHS